MTCLTQHRQSAFASRSPDGRCTDKRLAGGDAHTKNGLLLRPAAGGGGSPSERTGLRRTASALRVVGWSGDVLPSAGIGYAGISWDSRATGIPWFDGKLRQPVKLGLDLGTLAGARARAREGRGAGAGQRTLGGLKRLSLLVLRCRCQRSDPGSTGKERLASPRPPANRLPHPAHLAKQTMATETPPVSSHCVARVWMPRDWTS